MFVSGQHFRFFWTAQNHVSYNIRAGLLRVQRVQIIGAHTQGGAHKNPLLYKPEVKVSLYLLPFWRYKRFNMGIGAHTKIL